MRSSLIPVMALGVVLASCSTGSSVNLLSPTPATVSVGETLTLPLVIDNPEGLTIAYLVEPVVPGSLPSFDSVHAITGTPQGGTFRWSPLVSHVGAQELRFIVTRDGSVIDTETVVITVEPPVDAAPVFIQPGAGATFDLGISLCVEFAIEVRDADSASVDIRARSEMPAGASLVGVGPKSAEVFWCPSRDQVNSSQRWIFEFEASDSTHAPVPHDFVVVLRVPTDESCEGDSPVVTVLEPDNAARTESRVVRVRITDDMGLRDAPLLYWSTESPDDPSMPDVTTFEQVTLEAADSPDEFVGNIGLALDEGEARGVYFLVSATDNDDASGALCDHRTDGELQVITLVGAVPVADIAACDPCTRSADCISGVCASSGGSGVCLPTCDACETGTCGMFGSVEGPALEGCGDAVAACTPPVLCMEDEFEPNDSQETAQVLPEGRTESLAICEASGDFYRIDASFRNLVTFTVDNFIHDEGDIDLRVLDEEGTIVESSAGVGNSESVSYCARGSEAVYAQVFGYRGATNTYSIEVEREAGACCVDDSMEPDDASATARPDGSMIGGIICPGDDDYYEIRTEGPATVEIEVAHDLGDINIELLSPTGTSIMVSELPSSPEMIRADVDSGGRYLLRVYGSLGDASPYTGTLNVTSRAVCSESRDCAPGDVCDGGACRDGTCATNAMCPASHACPSTQLCSAECTVNSGCRSSEACKWSFEGRVCAQRGSGQNGDACTDAGDCGGQRECVLPEVGGYCARVECTRNADCESGTFCVQATPEIRVCAQSCVPGECRTAEGFECTFLPTLEGASESVCWPS